MMASDSAKKITEYTTDLQRIKDLLDRIRPVAEKAADHNENVATLAMSNISTGLMTIAAIYYELIFDEIKRAGEVPTA